MPEVNAEAQRSPQAWYSWRIPWALRARFPLLLSREICVVALSQGDAPALDPVLIKVAGGRTNPVTLVVSPGTRIAFKNADPFAHDITSGTANWSRAVMQPGGTREWTPTKPGVSEFRDDLFPSVRAFVVAEKKVAAFAFPADRDGSFVFTLQPGVYTVQAYFGGNPVGKPLADVTVPARGPVDLKEPLVVSAEGK
jgi:plastocyanin